MHESGIAQVVILSTFAITVWRLSRVLPIQNVIACVGLVIFISALIEMIGAKTGVPFGPFFYTDNLGFLLFRRLPWPVPFIWVVVLFNSRGAARVVLKPWRTTGNYGIWLLALTCFLVVLFDVALEPFATRVNRWWIWMTPKNASSWQGVPWVNFAGWGVASLLMLGIIMPWLINKSPAKEPSPDWVPLGVWLALFALLIFCSLK